MLGTVFDIKEFSLHDGPGIRTTVFLKGCPLRCIWCHNPEGLEPQPQILNKRVGCLCCGKCRVPCEHPECQGLGRCIHACPVGLVKVAGKQWDHVALADKLMQGAELFASSGGGVTVSGGEPLLQAAFAAALLDALPVHRIVETSGYADRERFRTVAERVDMLYMDVKLADREAHKRYTGVYNDPILENLRWLQQSGIPHLLRVPLIPDITDTPENLQAIARLAGSSEVELLPYNPLAGAKYAGVGKTFTTEIRKDKNRTDIDLSVFQNAHIRK